MEFDQLIVAVGQSVDPALAKQLKKAFGNSEIVEVDLEAIEVRNRPGIFAGGDIVRGAGKIVDAVADGRKSAKAISSETKWRYPCHERE